MRGSQKSWGILIWSAAPVGNVHMACWGFCVCVCLRLEGALLCCSLVYMGRIWWQWHANKYSMQRWWEIDVCCRRLWERGWAGVQGHVYTLALNVIQSIIFFLRAYCVLDFLQGSCICIIQCRNCLFFLPVFLGLWVLQSTKERKKTFLSFFWPCYTTCGILVPWPRIEPATPCIGSFES